MGESLPAGGASFDISVPRLVSTFNSEEGIILKNLPDGLLDGTQQQIKQKVIESDLKHELDIAARKLDKTIETSATQMDAVQQSLKNNRIEIKEQAIKQKQEKIQHNSIHLSR